MMQIEPAGIAQLQRVIDAMNPQQKTTALEMLRQWLREAPSMPAWPYIMMIALEHKCSVARAVENIIAMAADGEIAVSARIGSPDAPVSDLPASMFRHEV